MNGKFTGRKVPGCANPLGCTSHPHCERCLKIVKPGREVWLELNSHSGRWFGGEGHVPESQSQGTFLFGADCAKLAVQNA